MAKKRDILLTVLFCGFIGAMAALTAFLPKQEVSVNEKRTLAKFPEFSVQKLFNGKWEKDFETYISDHFPARNFFASTDSYYMLYSGRNGSNGVYKGKDGYIINTPVKCDEEKLNANITAINNFVKNTGIETKLIVVPSTGYIMSEELPKVHTEYNDGEIINDIKNRAENAKFIDIRDTLTENKDKQIIIKPTTTGQVTVRIWHIKSGQKVKILKFAVIMILKVQTDFSARLIQKVHCGTKNLTV